MQFVERARKHGFANGADGLSHLIIYNYFYKHFFIDNVVILEYHKSGS